MSNCPVSEYCRVKSEFTGAFLKVIVGLLVEWHCLYLMSVRQELQACISLVHGLPSLVAFFISSYELPVVVCW